MSSGVRNRRRVEASEDSRLSVHAHPVFRSLGCTSVAHAHQTPIWIRYERIAPPRSDCIGPQLIRAPESPRYPPPLKGNHIPQGLAAKATSQSVGDSATRRIEPTTVY